MDNTTEEEEPTYEELITVLSWSYKERPEIKDIACAVENITNSSLTPQVVNYDIGEEYCMIIGPKGSLETEEDLKRAYNRHMGIDEEATEEKFSKDFIDDIFQRSLGRLKEGEFSISDFEGQFKTDLSKSIRPFSLFDPNKLTSTCQQDN